MGSFMSTNPEELGSTGGFVVDGNGNSRQSECKINAFQNVKQFHPICPHPHDSQSAYLVFGDAQTRDHSELSNHPFRGRWG